MVVGFAPRLNLSAGAHYGSFSKLFTEIVLSECSIDIVKWEYF